MSIKSVVLDTNILVSALLSKDGNPAKIYRMFLIEALTLFYCKNILDEYQDVLYRPRLRIPQDDADIVITAVSQYGKEVWPMPSDIYMIDEDDRIFYDTAKHTGSYLISGNIKHYPAESFILTPTAFLEETRKWMI